MLSALQVARESQNQCPVISKPSFIPSIEQILSFFSVYHHVEKVGTTEHVHYIHSDTQSMDFNPAKYTWNPAKPGDIPPLFPLHCVSKETLRIAV